FLVPKSLRRKLSQSALTEVRSSGVYQRDAFNSVVKNGIDRGWGITKKPGDCSSLPASETPGPKGPGAAITSLRHQGGEARRRGRRGSVQVQLAVDAGRRGDRGQLIASSLGNREAAGVGNNTIASTRVIRNTDVFHADVDNDTGKGVADVGQRSDH